MYVKFIRFLPLALGLIYMGRRDAIETLSAALEVLPEPYKLASQTMLQVIKNYSKNSKRNNILHHILKILNKYTKKDYCEKFCRFAHMLVPVTF